MYNYERKETYMEETGKKSASSLFKKSEKYENEIGKDIGEMSKDEFKIMIRELKYENSKTIDSEVSRYQHYRKWCVDKKIPNSNNEHLGKKDKEDVLLNLSRYISYPEILEGVKKLRNPCDKVLILGIAERICKKADYSAFYQMDIKAFKAENGVFYFFKDGVKHPISEQLYLYANESAECYTNYSKQKNMPWQGDYVIKSYPNEAKCYGKNFENRIRSRIREAQRELEWEKVDLFLSVQLSQLHDLCMENNITIDELFKQKDLLQNFVKEYGDIRGDKKQFYLVEYKRSFPYDEFEYAMLKASSTKIIFDFTHRRMNYDMWEKQRTKLGELGEQFVYEREKKKIERYGLGQDKEVIWESKENGDGQGYDVLSYDKNGEIMYIEVKTTTAEKSEPFYITSRELDRSLQEGLHYYLYRVYNFDAEKKTGLIAAHNGNLSEMCKSPILYQSVCE